MRYTYRHPKGKSSRLGGAIALVLLVIVGGCGVWFSIQWFRAHSADRRAEARADDLSMALATAVDFAAPFEATMSVRSTAGNESLGTVQRKGTVESPVFSANLRLAPIDTAAQAYEIWMVKDGLADVQSVGELVVRADGSWTHEWTLRDSLEYAHLVIMLEPRDGNSAPSGNKIAEGTF